MKTCVKCGLLKPFSEFNKHKATRDGYRPLCKPCKAAALRAWRSANAEVVQEKSRQYYSTKMREWFQQRYVSKKADLNASGRVWRLTNPDKNCAKEARRRAAKLRAIPPWADADKIAEIYAQAAELRALGVDCHVDHIVPLQGRTVSGLHCQDNLQILLASDNLSKGNRLSVSV